jgi:hypothetical protein
MPAGMQAQGLRCSFSLNAQNVQNAGDAAYASMKQTIADFLNTTAWSQRDMQPFEQIECNIVLTITEQTAEYEYKGKLQVQAQRPVYGSAYNSVILNAVDNDAAFRYSPNEPLDFSMMSHNPNNLTPMLAYWIYIVMGIDGDTYSLFGGSQAMQTAQRIVQNAQGESRSGWSASQGSGRNRYGLVESYMSSRYQKLRQAYYGYHRMGLDLLSGSIDDGQKGVLSALASVQALYKEKPDAAMYPITLFFDAKADEIVNVLMGMSKKDKDDVYDMLSQTDILNEPKYRRLKE